MHRGASRSPRPVAAPVRDDLPAMPLPALDPGTNPKPLSQLSERFLHGDERGFDHQNR